ncbi:hypothetical protein ACS0TY_020703 [Phlomoides rotata]
MVEGVVIGKDKVMISHLQYADDTIFSCTGKLENIQVIKRILHWFELILGLKVNFDKSSIWGINMEAGPLELLGNRIGCVIGSAPFSYLGSMSSDKLWVRVIKSRYGAMTVLQDWALNSARTEGRKCPSSYSGWWRDVVNIYLGSGGGRGGSYQKL